MAQANGPTGRKRQHRCRPYNRITAGAASVVDDGAWSDRQIHEPIRVAMRDLLTIRRRNGKCIEECSRPHIGGKRIVDGEHDAVRTECHERGYERHHREEPTGGDPDLIEERLANRATEQPLRLSGGRFLDAVQHERYRLAQVSDDDLEMRMAIKSPTQNEP